MLSMLARLKKINKLILMYCSLKYLFSFHYFLHYFSLFKITKAHLFWFLNTV